MRYVIFAAVLLVICPLASAQLVGTVSGGYSHLGVQNHQNLLLDPDGVYVDGDLGWRLPTIPIPIQIGGGIGFSDYYESEDVTVPTGNNFFLETNDQSDFGMVDLEGRIAFPITFGSDRGFFLNPRLGAGLLIQYYDIDTQKPLNGGELFYTANHSAVGVEIHPNLQMGYAWGNVAVGAEASYMAGWGDWGAFGRKLDEYHLGVFATLKW